MAALLALRLAALALRVVPWRVSCVLGGVIGRLVHALAPWRLAVLRANLARARLPTSLERAAYEHLGRALMLTLQAPRLPAVAADHALLSQLNADCADGGVLVCSAHIGVWELLPSVLAPHVPERARRHGRLVYRPLHDAALDAWLRRRRTSAAGVAMLPDDGSLSELKESLCKGGLVGLLPDQRPAAGHGSVSVRMLGEACELSPGISALHAATGCPVWFAALVLCKSSDASLTLTRLAPRRRGGSAQCEPGHVACGDDVATEDAAHVSQAYADALDAAVRCAPAQFFWFHDRWRLRKKSRTTHEGGASVARVALSLAVGIVIVRAAAKALA